MGSSFQKNLLWTHSPLALFWETYKTIQFFFLLSYLSAASLYVNTGKLAVVWKKLFLHSFKNCLVHKNAAPGCLECCGEDLIWSVQLLCSHRQQEELQTEVTCSSELKRVMARLQQLGAAGRKLQSPADDCARPPPNTQAVVLMQKSLSIVGGCTRRHTWMDIITPIPLFYADAALPDQPLLQNNTLLLSHPLVSRLSSHPLRKLPVRS